MQVRGLLGVAAGVLMVLLFGSLEKVAAQGTSTVLTGVVSSDAEGKMEGVLVTVRRDGTNHTVTVVSDKQGRYSFPSTHVSAGTHSVAIRAIGYDLVDPGPATVTDGQSTTLDLTLQETQDLASQLTSLEWVRSMPGSTDMKDKLVYQAKSCNYCHNYERIMRSKHTASQFVRVIRRMNAYYPDGTAVSNDNRGWGQRLLDYGDSFGKMTPDGPMEGRGDRWGGWDMKELGEFLEDVNLSGGRSTWSYDLKASLPRPTGKGTRVIITQWDQPRKDTVSHDMDVDSKGNVWYGDESHQFVGMLNPNTHTFTDYPLPPVPEGHLPGTRDVQVDNDDNVWFPMRVAGGASRLTKFEPATEKVTIVPETTGQFIALGPNNKMWMGGAGNAFTRVDISTAKVEATFPGRGYQVVVNSEGNPYIGGGPGIVGFDVKANEEKAWKLPNQPECGPQSFSYDCRRFARRGKMDPEDRFWFAEYYGDKIGMFNTKTEEIKEWSLRKYSTPYSASAPDQKGHVWANSNMSDRLFRLNPETGEVVEYLMPTEIDTKEMVADPSTDRVVMLMTNMRNARVVRVEILD